MNKLFWLTSNTLHCCTDISFHHCVKSYYQNSAAVTSTLMAGPNFYQQILAKSITLPLLACILPIVHPGAMCSLGMWCTCTRPFTWCKRKCNSSDQATLFHCSVVQFWCSCAHFWHFWHIWRWIGSAWAPWLVCSYVALLHCVFWHLSILLKSYACPFFLLLTHNFEDNIFTHCLIHPTH